MNEPSRTFVAICRQAIQLNHRPIPYVKAFLAGLATGLPVLAGIIFDNFQAGLIASLGGFAFLYVFRMPYIHRVKKITFCILGLSLCAFLGSLFTAYPIMLALLMAIIAGFMVFTFGALNIVGPSAIFMVLVFAMTSAMPETDLYGALTRSLLVASGGALSLFFALMGWFVDPHKPEREVIQRLYAQLNQLIERVGTAEFKKDHADFMPLMDDANHMMQTSFSGWYQSRQFKILFHLNKRANRIWVILGEQFSDRHLGLSQTLVQAFSSVSQSVQQLSKVQLDLEHHHSDEQRLVVQLQRIETILNQGELPRIEVAPITLPLSTIWLHSFNRHSIPLISATRFAAITLISALIAYSFEFPRSFWVPLSTVSVISGITVVATLHRSIQRALGTVLGVCVAMALLAFDPDQYLVAFYIFFFSVMSEIFIVKNYGITTVFFTPSALIITVASTGMPDSARYFAEVRVMDVLIGTAIGLAGIFLINRHAASRRLHHSMAELIRVQAKLSFAMFNGNPIDEKQLREKYFFPMKIRWNNLTILQQTMMGEIPRPVKQLEQDWPLSHELKQLSYLLERIVNSNKKQVLAPSELARLLLVYEQMSTALELPQWIHKVDVPQIPEFPLVTVQLEKIQQIFIQRQLTN